MGYFSNGTEGDIYQERYCNHCVHDVNQDCPILLLHLLWNYDDERDRKDTLNMFIPIGEDGWNQRCVMFVDTLGQGALETKFDDLNEYVTRGIENLMANAASGAASLTNDPDEVAAIPMAFFRATNILLSAWLRFVESESEKAAANDCHST